MNKYFIKGNYVSYKNNRVYKKALVVAESIEKAVKKFKDHYEWEIDEINEIKKLNRFTDVIT